MAEYVERNDAIKCIEDQCVDGKMWGNEEQEGTLIDAYSAIDELMEVPAADVAPVVHGRWILGEVEPGYLTPGGNRPWICSECGQVVSWMLGRPQENYCKNCGAKMDGGGDHA